MADIINYYPTDILNNVNRMMKIIVVEQDTLSGAADELKKKVETIWNQSKELYSGQTNTSGPSDAATQKQLRSRTKKLASVKTVYGIALPLPNQIQDSQTHDWSESEGFVAQNLNKLVDKDLGVGGIKTSVNKALGELSSATGYRKPMVDPGYYQDYGGTKPRNFTFTWDLIPNSQAEADQIMSILYNLKKFTLPTATINGVSLQAPYLFDILIGNERLSNIINLNNVVCKSMEVNYAAEGALQFYADGIPKFIQLTMSFAERSTVTADFY